MATDSKSPAAATSSIYPEGRLASASPPSAKGALSDRSGTFLRGKKKSYRPGKQLTLKNLKTLLVTGVAMAAVLFIFIHALKWIWARRDQMYLQSWSPAEVAVPVPTPAGGMGDSKGAETAVVRSAESANLDSDRLRSALASIHAGERLEAAGALDEALSQYERAIEQWPHASLAWRRLGHLRLRRGQYREAVTAFERALQTNPENVELINNLGAALYWTGQFERAKKLFETAIELNPALPLSHLNLALTDLALGHRAAARARFGRYLEQFGTDARALRELAFIDASEGRYEEARRALEEAVEHMPEWGLLHLDLAAVCALMNQPEEALAYLRTAEPLTSPAAVRRIFREPAFRVIRQSEEGRAFESELAARTRAGGTEELAASGSISGPLTREPMLY